MKTALISMAFMMTTFLLVSCGSDAEKNNYDFAVQALQENKQEEAVRFLIADLQENPNSYRSHLKLAECYQNLGQYEKAIRVLDKARVLEPDNPEAWLTSAETYIKMAQAATDQETRNALYLQGQNQFSKVLELPNLTEEQQANANLGKGICLIRRTLFEDAQKYIQIAVSLKPNDPEVLYYNGLIKQAQLGPNKMSLKSYEAVLNHNPKHLATLQELTGVYRFLGYNQKALEYGQKYLSAGGQDTIMANWVAAETKPAPVVPTTSASPTTTTPAPTPPLVSQVVMICPMCGRCGQVGQTTCAVDGSPLMPME